MNISEFLGARKRKILGKVLACGEDKSKFYQPMLEEEEGMFLYVIGCEAENNSELRIAINSRNKREIASLEKIISEYKQSWRYVGKGTYKNKDMSFNFADYATLVYTQRENFTSNTYSSKINELLNYIIELMNIFSSQIIHPM